MQPYQLPLILSTRIPSPSYCATLLPLPLAPNDDSSSRLLAELLELPAISTTAPVVLASETPLPAKPLTRQRVNTRGTFGGFTFHSESTKPSSSPVGDDWFTQLPPKVRKAQFTLAEQVLLAQQSSTCIPPRRSHTHSHGNYTLTSSKRLRQSASTLTCSSSSGAMPGARPSSSYSRRTSHESHNSRLDDYPTSPRESSFTRGIGVFKQSPKIGHRAFSRPSLRHQQVSTCETIEDASSVEEATPRQYLRDPATQQKLKLYFGTDEKFAEILEHGFPVSSSRDVQQDAPKPTRPQPNHRKRTAISDYQKALRRDSLSFLDDPEDEGEEDDADDDDEIDERSDYSTRRINAGGHYQLNDDGCYSPVYASSISSSSTNDLDTSPSTPRMSAQPQPFVATMTTLPSMPSTSSMGMESKLFSPAFLFGCDRESTLRVTLTRPEYRPVDEKVESQTPLQRPGYWDSRLLSTETSSVTYPICYDSEMEDEQAFKDDQDFDDTNYQIDLMRPSMDLLALEPLQILPDHAAIATLTKATRKENRDNAVRGIINRVRSSRTLEQVQSRPRVQSNPHSHPHGSWTCM